MIYLDNAATSFPKPPEVIRAMAGVEEKMGANPGRGGHRLALRAVGWWSTAGRRLRGCWVCIIRSGFCSPQTAPKR